MSSDHPNHYQASGFASYPLYVQDRGHQFPASPTRSDSGNNTKISAVHQPAHRHIEHNAFQGRDSGNIQDLNTSSSGHGARNLPTARPDAGYASLVGSDTAHRTKYAL